ncbi:MAG: GAP family protein [Thermomicrobiales bacterium]
MVDALSDVVPIAFGLAMVNPLPIMAVILLLFSPRAVAVVPAFLVGWLGGLLVFGSVLIFVVPAERLVGTERDPSTLASVVRIVLGIALLWLAARKWMTRPKGDETPKLPGWVTSLESASPASALGIGAALAGLNPKNVVFSISAAVAIAEWQLANSENAVLLIVYAVIGSLGVLIPAIWRAVGGESAGATLQEWRLWLSRNYNALMGIVFLIFGVLVVSKGVSGLLH